MDGFAEFTLQPKLLLDGLLQEPSQRFAQRGSAVRLVESRSSRLFLETKLFNLRFYTAERNPAHRKILVKAINGIL